MRGNRDRDNIAVGDGNGGGKPRGNPLSNAVLTCLGFGLLLSYYPVGNVGSTFLVNYAGTDTAVLIARTLYFAALVATLLLIHRMPSARKALLGSRGMRLSFLAMGVAFCLAPALASLGVGGSIAAPAAFALLLGAANAAPVVRWYELFLHIYRSDGRMTCMLVVATSSLVSALLAPFKQAVVAGYGFPSLLVMLSLVAGSFACLEVLARRVSNEPRQPDRDRTAPAFQPSRQVAVIMISFGIVWSLSYSLAAKIGYGRGFGDPSVWGTSAAGIFTNVVIILFCYRILPTTRGSFGIVLRYTVLSAGMVWSLMFVMLQMSPALAGFLCGSCYLFVIVCASLLMLELGDTSGLEMADVLIPCLATAAIGGLAGKAIFFALLQLQDGVLGAGLASAVGLMALFSIAALMPNLQSRAIDLETYAMRREDAREEGAQDEGGSDRDGEAADPARESTFDKNLARSKAAVAQRAGLSPREIQVMELLLDGHPREEIADILGLSPHTVKNYSTSMYGKLGIHSRRELNVLVLNACEEL